jgi:hypothetical protein
MVSANHFRDMISDYLLGSVDLEGFSKKFEALFDDIEDSGDAGAIELSYQIESSLADVSAGLVSENVLRETLSKCVDTVKIIVNPDYVAPLASKPNKGETSSPYEVAEVDYEYA